MLVFRTTTPFTDSSFDLVISDGASGFLWWCTFGRSSFVGCNTSNSYYDGLPHDDFLVYDSNTGIILIDNHISICNLSYAERKIGGCFDVFANVTFSATRMAMDSTRTLHFVINYLDPAPSSANPNLATRGFGSAAFKLNETLHTELGCFFDFYQFVYDVLPAASSFTMINGGNAAFVSDFLSGELGLCEFTADGYYNNTCTMFRNVVAGGYSVRIAGDKLYIAANRDIVECDLPPWAPGTLPKSVGPCTTFRIPLARAIMDIIVVDETAFIADDFIWVCKIVAGHLKGPCTPLGPDKKGLDWAGGIKRFTPMP